tara:strand:+ start:141 stop:563 length:423 start_codon:yes stop_codon:yes gene_type:complete
MLGGGGIGGAPNVVAGSNPGGIGSYLNTIGNHVYANSGSITVTSGSYRTGLNFTNPTGNQYVIAQLYVNSADTSSADIFFKVELDGQTIMNQIIKEAGNLGESAMPFVFLIPPYSKVTVSGQRGSGSDLDVFFNIVGRIY